jgi:hypothetical protein
MDEIDIEVFKQNDFAHEKAFIAKTQTLSSMFSEAADKWKDSRDYSSVMKDGSKGSSNENGLAQTSNRSAFSDLL